MDYHCVVDLSKVADQQLTVRQVINMENVPTTRDPAVSTARGNTIEQLTENQVTDIARNLFDSIDKNDLGEITKQ